MNAEPYHRSTEAECVRLRHVVDVLFLLSLAALLVLSLQDMLSGGHPWRQGDWLVNNSAHDVRRGYFGTIVLAVSDTFGAPVLSVLLLFQWTALVVLFVSFRKLALAGSDGCSSALLLMSPALFSTFWIADPLGALRKELLVFAGLSIATLSLARGRFVPFWVGVAFVALGVMAHEAMVLFVPLLLAILLTLRLSRAACLHALLACGLVTLAAFHSLLVAVSNTHPTDMSAICTALTDRGIDEHICSGAIEWLGHSIADAFRLEPNFLPAQSLAGFLVSYAAALAPLLYLALHAENPFRWIKASFLAGVPFLPLYFAGVDWGRWMSFHVFSIVLLLMAAKAAGTFRLRVPLSGRSVVIFVILALCISPNHTIGVTAGGAMRQMMAQIVGFLS